MEIVISAPGTLKADAVGIKDVIKNSPTPDWFPEPVKEKMSQYDGPYKDRLTARIEKTLESTLDVIAREFNTPTFDRFAKLKTERERTKLLSAMGIKSGHCLNIQELVDIKSIQRKLL